MTGSPVKCIDNQMETLEIALSQMTLHLLADHANSHEEEVTWWPAGHLVSS